MTPTKPPIAPDSLASGHHIEFVLPVSDHRLRKAGSR